MRNRLKPLPQMVLTDLQPSFYDVVSVSTDQMVAKFYSYLQQWVDDYNSYVNDINAIIDEFTRCTDLKYEEFTQCVKDLMSNYIESVDTKIALQDSKIAEALEDATDYMKNNLVTTVNNLFTEALENQEIVASLNVNYDSSNEELTFSILAEEGD